MSQTVIEAPTALQRRADPERPATVALILLDRGPPSTLWSVTEPCVVGRSDADVRLDDPLVSRRHAIVSPARSGVTVMDLGSSNGTSINTRRLDAGPTFAAIGSIIRAGDSLLLVAPLPLEAAESPEPDGAPEEPPARRARIDTEGAPEEPPARRARIDPGLLVGGTALAPARRLISLVARTALTVLIGGETGTGKEIVAHMLHAASGRSGRLIAVNCAALAETMIDAELFGHVRGAFTGAQAARSGLFAAAHGGTLFLDEVGELTPAAQAKLLRALEEQQIRPVGAEASHRIDVRVVCATHRDLRQAVSAGTFRADLMARLTTVELRLPPLREHLEDLPVLIEHLLRRAGHHELTVSTDALEAMAIYRWPQNVRELDNVLRGSAIMSTTEIDVGVLPNHLVSAPERPPAPPRPITAALPPLLQSELRPRVEAVLREHQGNVRRACTQLGMSRGKLYRLLKQWNVDPDSYRAAIGAEPANDRPEHES